MIRWHSKSTRILEIVLLIATVSFTGTLRAEEPELSQEAAFPQLDYLSYKQPLAPIPRDFMYKGKPINPVCIDKFFGVKAATEVELNDCSTPPASAPCGYSEDHSKAPWSDMLRGFIGYCYPQGKEPTGHFAIAYKYIGKLPQGHVVNAEFCPTDQSSQCADDFFIFTIANNRLIQVKELRSETRLGASDVRIVNGKLDYLAPIDAEMMQKLSRADFSDIADPKDWHTTQDRDGGWIYEKLFLNAATLGDDDVGEFEDDGLLKVYLMKYTGDFAKPLVEDTPQNHRQNCFLKVHNSYIEKNKTVLSPKELKQFMQEVIDTCKH